MELDKLPLQLIDSFQLAEVSLPHEKTATDLFATVRSKPSDPGKTIRLRLTPPLHAALAYSLTESLDRDAKDDIQRLFQGGSVVQVLTSPNNEEGFLLTLQQTNLSRGQERPVRMLLAPQQLDDLAEALQQARELSRAPPDRTH